MTTDERNDPVLTAIAEERRPFPAKPWLRICGTRYFIDPEADISPRESAMIAVFISVWTQQGGSFDPASALEWLAQQNLLRHFKAIPSQRG